MCEKCNHSTVEEFEDVEYTEDELSPTLLSQVQLQSQYSEEYLIDPILIDIENLTEVCLNEEKFQEGLKDISKTCGMITGLVNAGLSVIDALNYLTNQEIMENNIKLAEINKEASVGIAKEQSLHVDKNSL